MARDARRTKSVTFTEEQTKWIEAQIAAGVPDHGTVIKSAVDRAMAPVTAEPKIVAEIHRTEAQPKVDNSFLSKSLCEISATLDVLLKKYMADHPARELTPEEESDLFSRWDAIVALRSHDGDD